MIHADGQPGVAAGTLDSTLQNLRRTLGEYRAELQKSEAAFSAWEAQWRAREREIDAHLQLIQSRLGTTAQTPTLSLVCSDE